VVDWISSARVSVSEAIGVEEGRLWEVWRGREETLDEFGRAARIDLLVDVAAGVLRDMEMLLVVMRQACRGLIRESMSRLMVGGQA